MSKPHEAKAALLLLDEFRRSQSCTTVPTHELFVADIAGVAMLIARFSTSGLARSYVDLLATQGKRAQVVFRPGRGHELNPFVVEPLPENSQDDGPSGATKDGADA